MLIQNDKRCRLEASMGLEAALVVPLVVFALTALIVLIISLGLQMRVRHVMHESLREVSALPYSLGKKKEEVSYPAMKTAAFAALSASFYKNISSENIRDSYIEGGTSGIVLDGSRMFAEGADMKTGISYRIKQPFSIFGLGSVRVDQDCDTYAWLGDSFMKKSHVAEKMVYITPHGTVYHEDRECTYIAPKVFEAALSDIPSKRNASGAKYYECEGCTAKTAITPSILYITEYGDRYHSDPRCVKIKHEIIEIPISQVGDRRKCSKEK